MRRRFMGRLWRAAAIAALALVAACATAPTEQTPDTVAPPQGARFSGQPPGEALPPGWQPWTLSAFKHPTRYRLVSSQGKTVVRAEAQGSASGLVHPLALDPGTWPLRQVVSFAGNMDKLPARERMFFDSVRILTGQQLPYATLMYIWENRVPRETVIPSRHTSRIRLIVAESGRDRLGSWQEVTRNVVEDYRRAFGEEPGRITAVGIMTDTDNTGGNLHAYYGDILFRRTGPAGVTFSSN